MGEVTHRIKAVRKLQQNGISTQHVCETWKQFKATAAFWVEKKYLMFLMPSKIFSFEQLGKNARKTLKEATPNCIYSHERRKIIL